MIVWVEWRGGGGRRRPSLSFFFFFLHRGITLAATLSHAFHLSFSCLPKRRKTWRCRGSIVLSAAWEEVPHMDQQISLLPHPRSIFLSSFRFRLSLPARCSIHTARAARRAHRRFKVATVLAGKLFDRLPLNHSSRTPALLSSILPPPMADSTTLDSLSLSFSLALLCDGRAPLPFRALLLARWIDALLALGKITMDIITRTRAEHTGDVVAN